MAETTVNITEDLRKNVKQFTEDFLSTENEGGAAGVDSKAEASLKKLQAESENVGRDENTAIELGKITTAKFALFTKIRKVGENYVIAVDFTDLTTGEQMASCMSKEYSKADIRWCIYKKNASGCNN